MHELREQVSAYQIAIPFLHIPFVLVGFTHLVHITKEKTHRLNHVRVILDSSP
jgi:hypothetical protein